MQKTLLIKDSLDDIYHKVLKDIILDGVYVCPRQLATKELHPYMFTLTKVHKNIVTSPLRAINVAFMLSELVWLLSGSDDVEFVSMFNTNMKKFSDDGLKMNGAYGPRLINFSKKVNQLTEVIMKLSNDPDSRQCVVVIFDPSEDYKKTKDVPCNNLLKFSIRNKKLDMGVYVRSQDAILGLPYDVFHWTVLQQLMANMLNIETGIYYHVMDSVHLYDDLMGMKQVELAAMIIADYADNKIVSKSSNDMHRHIDLRFNSIHEMTTIFYQLREAIELKKFDFMEELNDERYKSSFLHDIIVFFKHLLLNAPYSKTIYPHYSRENRFLMLHSNYLCRKMLREVKAKV